MPDDLLRQEDVSFNQSAYNFRQSRVFENIMVRQKFPNLYKKQYWHQIAQYQSSQFTFDQKNILKYLLNDQDSFSAHFKKFYNNHLKLYQWYELANEKHQQMRQYIFTDLLRKSLSQYKIYLKDNMVRNLKLICKKQPNFSITNYCMRSVNDSPKKVFTLAQGKNTQSMMNSIHQSGPISPKNECASEDYHQLFVRTLDACDGSKYIYYDFGKHQKGYQNRKSYNKFIRRKYQNRSNQKAIKSNDTKSKWKKKQHQTCSESFGITKGQQCYRNLKSSNCTFSVLKSRQNSLCQDFTYSKFQISVIDDENSSLKFWKNKGKQNGRKNGKMLVLKKMPHVFGKQKPFSGTFTIKTYKPPSTIKTEKPLNNLKT